MDLGIQGKVALVTGGSRGLGRVAALSLAREGVNVAICGRTQSTLDGTVAEIEALGVRGQGVVADVSNPEAMPVLNQAVVDGLGAIDILVNNAGGSRAREDLADLPLDDFKAAFDLNLFGGFQLMREVIPHMRAQKWGRIINIASIYGREYGGNLAYMSAKAALIGATKHAALSLVTDGVLVNSIAPGSIEHPEGSWERFQNENPPEVVADFISRNLPLGRFGWPEPVGDLVAFLASQRADLITGSCIVVDGGQSYSMI
ncbi:MAG: SDR family NAD(P)-dependent oxidoreductase [Chloroflexota bacterium]|nr:SDR family NAD(P)-dependent oxidoreductase [Chloroflexota bacterium]